MTPFSPMPTSLKFDDHCALTGSPGQWVVFCPPKCGVEPCWLMDESIEGGDCWDELSFHTIDWVRVYRGLDGRSHLELLPLPTGRTRCQLREGRIEGRTADWALRLAAGRKETPRYRPPCRVVHR